MSRHRLRIFFAIALSPAIIVATARGDRIASRIKSSATPANSRTQIESVLNPLFKSLASNDPDAQKEARTALVSESESHAGATATPQYESEYAQDLAKGLMPLTASPNLRVRMNAAIITSEVASKVFYGGGDASLLAGLDRKLLNDKDVAVVLWAVKAAKFVLASTLQQGASASALAKELVKAVETHGQSGPIVEEAYKTLTFDNFEKFNGSGNPQFATEAAPVIPDLLDLIAWRTRDYQSGIVPPSSQAENPVPVFLSVKVYGVLSSNPALRDRTLKVMGEMSCAVMQTIGNGNGTPDLVDIVKDYGKAFEAFGVLMENADVSAAGKAISNVSNNTLPTKIASICQGLSAALKTVGVTLESGNGAGAAETPAQPALAGAPR